MAVAQGATRMPLDPLIPTPLRHPPSHPPPPSEPSQAQGQWGESHRPASASDCGPAEEVPSLPGARLVPGTVICAPVLPPVLVPAPDAAEGVWGRPSNPRGPQEQRLFSSSASETGSHRCRGPVAAASALEAALYLEAVSLGSARGGACGGGGGQGKEGMRREREGRESEEASASVSPDSTLSADFSLATHPPHTPAHCCSYVTPTSPTPPKPPTMLPLEGEGSPTPVPGANSVRRPSVARALFPEPSSGASATSARPLLPGPREGGVPEINGPAAPCRAASRASLQPIPPANLRQQRERGTGCDSDLGHRGEWGTPSVSLGSPAPQQAPSVGPASPALPELQCQQEASSEEACAPAEPDEGCAGGQPASPSALAPASASATTTAPVLGAQARRPSWAAPAAAPLPDALACARRLRGTPKVRLSLRHGASADTVASYVLALGRALKEGRAGPWQGTAAAAAAAKEEGCSYGGTPPLGVGLPEVGPRGEAQGAAVLGPVPGAWVPSTVGLEEAFQRERDLGGGHFGAVSLCRERASGRLFACKTILKSSLKRREDVDELCAEVVSMLTIQGGGTVGAGAGGGHLVRLHEVVEDASRVHLIMDYCNGGDLFEHIRKSGRLREPEAAGILLQLITAVQHMHSQGLIHRDVKPENVLLHCCPARPGQFQIKLGDFGLCAQAGARGQQTLGLAGSPFYMAPEVVAGAPYGKQVDVWSMGVVLYTALAGYLPFWGKTKEAIFQAVLRAKPDMKRRPWPCISPEAKHLIQMMLNPAAKRRATVQEVLGHPWMLRHCPPIKRQSVSC